MLYPWVVFIHVGSTFLFMLAHGATAAGMFKMRAASDRPSIDTLMQVRHWAEMPFNITSALMILSGVALGFMGHWWRFGWIWLSLGILLFLTLIMGFMGRRYFDRVEASYSPEAMEQAEANPNSIEGQIKQAVLSGRPGLLAAVGIAGFLFILWLMMFKPF